MTKQTLVHLCIHKMKCLYTLMVDMIVAWQQNVLTTNGLVVDVS